MKLLLSLALALVLAPGAAAADRTDRLDYGFGGQGWKTFLVAGRDSGAQEVIRTANGKLLVGGYSGSRLGFARLHPSGRFDRRFGRAGRAVVDPPGDTTGVRALAEVAGGRVLVGFGYTNYFAAEGAIGVLRLRADGRLEPTYGDGGVARVVVPGLAGEVGFAGMAELPDGGVLLVANARVDGALRAVVMLLDAGGRQVGEPRLHDLQDNYVEDLVRTAGGGFVLAALDRGDLRPLLLAMTAGGELIPERRFELPGVQLLDVARERGGVALLLSDGNGRWGVRRYTAGLRGRGAPARINLGGPRPEELAIDRRGRPWVALEGGRVARLRRDGTRDRRFGLRGRSTLFTDEFGFAATSVLPHPRGGAFVIGRAHKEFDLREDYGPSRMWMARFY